MSFKIICNECGEEVVFENNFEGITSEMIYIYPITEERVVIEYMECGNKITSR